MGLFSKAPSSGNKARERLKAVLVIDRMNNSAHVIEMMKSELLMVLKKYLSLDENDFDLHIQQSQDNEYDNPRLVADIPIKSLNRKA